MKERQTNYRRLGIGAIALGAALAVNSLIGPLLASLVTYPLSETVLNEAIGLEAVSLILVAPLALAAGVLSLRGHRAGPVLALAPTAYTAYMFTQYVVGMQAPAYSVATAWHLAIFVLSTGLLLYAWQLIDPACLPAMGAGSRRRWAVVVGLLGLFVLTRYVEAFAGMAASAPLPAEYEADVSMYWSILWLDLGLVVPVGLTTAVGLWRGTAWADKALYGFIGWFALVPASVSAMALVKVLRNDEFAAPGLTLMFGVATLVSLAVALLLFRRLSVWQPTAQSEGRSTA